ncbi:MAG: hypothetical protein ACI8ZO_000485 [Flavobacteriales bacterium]|jgi:hypothetical protein
MRKIAFLFLFNFMCLCTIGQIDKSFFLIARNTGIKQLANNDSIRVFGFATKLGDQPNVPGPTLIMDEGDSIKIDLWNVSQGAPHTIHLHGLDVNQQNDGVPHLSFEVHHMRHGYYYFKAPHPGTYLYHCHVASVVHVQAGMYGLIIVRPSGGTNSTWEFGYAFDNDLPLLTSEIDTTWHRDSVLLHPYDTAMEMHHVKIPDYRPQHFLINGFSDQQLAENNIALSTQKGKVSYLRLANIGYNGNRFIFPSQLNAQLISSDGRPLPKSEFSDTVYVYPGERYGVLVSSENTLSDSIVVEYLNLNTSSVLGTQKIPVSITELSIPEIEDETLSLTVFPNPFPSKATIQLSLESACNIQMELIDVNGTRLAVLANGSFSSGDHIIDFNTEALESGVYFIQVVKNGVTSLVQKIIKA